MSRASAEIVLNSGEVIDVQFTANTRVSMVAKVISHQVRDGCVHVDDPESFIIPSSSIKYARVFEEPN